MSVRPHFSRFVPFANVLLRYLNVKLKIFRGSFSRTFSQIDVVVVMVKFHIAFITKDCVDSLEILLTLSFRTSLMISFVEEKVSILRLGPTLVSA